jgi:hypothetical protein
MSVKHKALKATTMQNHSNDTNHSELDRLMEAEAANAEYRMHQCGHAGLVFTMITPQKIQMIPGLFVEDQLETFATILRLSSIAEAARVGVLTWQVWIAILPPGERPTPAISAYNHPQRREGVIQCGEALGGIYSNRFLPVLRDPKGCFTEFGPAQAWPAGPMPTQFNRLLPACAPSAQERQAAAKALAAIWIPIDQVDMGDSDKVMKPRPNPRSISR